MKTIRSDKYIYILIFKLSFISIAFTQVKDDLPGGTNQNCSNSFNITKFDGGKDLKVVVSGKAPLSPEIISFKATNPMHIVDSTTYKWNLGTGGRSQIFTDKWKLKIKSIKKGGLSGDAFIPESSIPQDNTSFGNSFGVIHCESINPPNDAFSNDLFPGSNLKNVEIYFRKDDPNFYDSSVPNWFYYWYSAAKANGLDISPGTKLAIVNPLSPGYIMNTNPTPIQIKVEYSKTGPYKYTNGQSGTAGSHVSVGTIKREATGEILPDGRHRMVGVGYWNQKITLGEWCGFEINEFDPPVNGSLIKLTAIEAFTSTLIHEMQHFTCMTDLWPNGYISDLDTDDDLFPDIFEDSSAYYGFNKNFKELPYDSTYNPAHIELAMPVTFWQEDKCRKEGHSKKNTLNDYDWSYDPKNTYQGKNWIKK